MQVKKLETILIEAPFKGTMGQTFKVNDSFLVSYNRIYLYSYLSLIKDGGSYKLEFGCQKVTPTEVREAYKALIDGPQKVTDTGLKSKTTNKFVSAAFKEESENFYITETNRALSKSDYTKETRVRTVEPIKFDDRYYRFRGYALSKDKKEVMEKLKYLVDLCNIIDENWPK